MNDRRSFLSALLRTFGEIGGRNPIGRSLSQCYAHALAADPRLFEDILGIPLRRLTGGKLDIQKLEVKPEHYRLEGGNVRKGRRADICVLYNNRPRAIVEIKVEDQTDDDPTGQLASYVLFARQHNVPFFYLTKYSISRDEEECIRSLPKRLRFHRRHYQIADALKERSTSELAQMITRYLEDEHMSGYQPLHVTQEDLLNFARRLLPVLQGGYGTKLHSEGRTNKLGQIITQCLNNARMIGDWLGNTHEAEFRFTVYPTVETYWELRQVIDYFEKHPDEIQDNWIHPWFSTGGCFYFAVEGRYAKGAGGHAVGVWASLWIELKRTRKKHPLQSGLYVEFWGAPLKVLEMDDALYDRWHPHVERTWPLNKSESETRDALSKMIVEAQKRLLRLQKHPNKKLKAFATAKATQRLAKMTFSGLRP